MGALLLVPAAQAFAEATVKVNVTGSGSGEVTGGKEELEPPVSEPGTPPMACSYNGKTASGVCENVATELTGVDTEWLIARPAAGSEFGGWTQQKGAIYEGFGYNCPHHTGFFEGPNPRLECQAYEESGGEFEEFEMTATFCKEGTAIEEEVFDPFSESMKMILAGCEEPAGPTNRRTLTLTKSPNPATGEGTGTVVSKPKGIKCGAACTEAVASMYEATPVLLKAKPAKEQAFVEWTGACAGVVGEECTIPMTENEEVGAVFSGISKEILNPTALTVNKGEGSGEGTVKGPGLGCEAQCTETTVLYQGPLTEPKEKAGKTVVLKQAPAFGSEFTGWVGCDEVNGEGSCVVEMSEAKTVSAEYAPLPNLDLTVHKGPYESGAGTVLSKPKGVGCGSYCTEAVASMPEGAAIQLTAKPAKENSFVKWEGGDCNESTEAVCVVTMDVAETVKAVFAGPTKTINPAETLTVTKGESSGFGTVKGAGLKCEALCTSESVIYQGPLTEPKPKAGKTVVLKSLAAPGSAAVLWGGCDSEDEEGNCVIEMSEPKTVTGTFEELE
ncbi:MAG: InlB B-repeat-containing protein [Chloroflexota bacterium]